MRHILGSPLFLIAFSLSLFPISAMAEGTNALETLQQTLQKQEQALLDGYDQSLGTIMAESKKKGDLDLYLVVETEQKRFETEKTVSSLSDANVALKTAAGNYHKARAGILRQYVTALDGLIKTEVQADRMESAKAAKAEKDKIAFELADLESRLPKPAARVDKSPRPAAKKAEPQKKSSVDTRDPSSDPEGDMPASSENLSHGRPLPRTMKIPANRHPGVSLGKLKKGNRIALEYVGGKWTDWNGKVASESPDESGSHHTLKILGKPKGEELGLEVGVPAGTQGSPFVYTFEKDMESVGLGMGDFTTGDNSGDVVYKVSMFK